MTQARTKKLLSSDARKAALELAKKSAGRSRLSANGRKEQYKPAAAFSDLPEYQEIRKIRAAADMFGVSNPFFRPHEVRAGATTRINGETLSNFASYDYLGLNGDPRVAEAAREAVDQFGTSASASRVVAGERPVHRKLEKALADHYGVEDAVVLVSGHATNVGTIGHLLGEKDLLIHDAYIHNSVVEGAKLSGARRRSFQHNDLENLQSLLREHRNSYRNVLVVVEGLYSMDGDTIDLASLIEIKDHYGAWLMVDEAHALGVTGETGLGSREKCGIDPSRVDIWMGTLSKTLSASGGYIAGNSALIELLKTQAPGFVYSVGLSPPLAAAACRALELLHDETWRVKKLRDNGQFFLNTCKELGLDTGYSEGYAVTPVLVGDSLKAAKLADNLLRQGINVMPIVYPAVPMQSARLRFFVTAEHEHDQLKNAAELTREELQIIQNTNMFDAVEKS